jgi:hypothetical protein
MRITATAVFKVWLEDHYIFPYTTFKYTRQSFFLEWVLLKSDWAATGDILRVQTEYFPVHVSCLPARHLQRLLMVGEAMPLMPVMDEVMNEMLVWGQGLSYKWYCDTLELLAYFTEHGIEPNRELLVSEVIQLYVKVLLANYYAPTSFTYSLLVDNWSMHFENGIYCHNKTFYAMVNSTAEYVKGSIAQIQH